MRPLMISSAAFRVAGWDRCCSPVWKTRLVFAYSVDHHPSLSDRVAQRLFAIDVLAGLTCMDAGQIVPVFGRGIDDDIDVFAIQHLAIVLVDLGLVLLTPLLGPGQIQVGTATMRACLRRFALVASADL